MPRALLLPLALVAVILIGAQLVIPPVAERTVEERLEEEGGSAEVELSAVPAIRLLWDDGDSLDVTGEGLELDPRESRETLKRLDGFGDVRIRLDDFEVEPLEVDSFDLTNGEDNGEYIATLSATTTARDLGRFLGSRAGGPFGGLLGGFAGGSLPGGGAELPVQVEADIESRDGEIEVQRARGDVAGLPAGPFAELVIEAVVRLL
jgi:hypothetical protein